VALRQSIATASEQPGRAKWNAQMQEEFAGAIKVGLLLNGTEVNDPSLCEPRPLPSTGSLTAEELERGFVGGCSTVKVIVPQLPGYELEPGHDEVLALIISGHSVYANATTEGGTGAQAIAFPHVRIRARYPCR